MNRKVSSAQAGTAVAASKGPIQEWTAKRYEEHASFVPLLGQPVLDLLNPQPGERILDVGCGDGALSERIRQAGATVVGVDESADMVEAARRRGIDARLADACALDFDGEFDAAFSNAALHWMKRDPDSVLAAVRKSLKPGGRFAAEFGGHGNVAAITVALVAVLRRRGVANPESLNPWYFPATDEYATRLEHAGFRADSIELFPRPVVIPTDMRGWLETFAGAFFAALPQAQRAAALEEAIELLRPVLRDGKGRWTVDYVRLRFLARAR